MKINQPTTDQPTSDMLTDRLHIMAGYAADLADQMTELPVLPDHLAALPDLAADASTALATELATDPAGAWQMAAYSLHQLAGLLHIGAADLLTDPLAVDVGAALTESADHLAAAAAESIDLLAGADQPDGWSAGKADWSRSVANELTSAIAALVTDLTDLTDPPDHSVADQPADQPDLLTELVGSLATELADLMAAELGDRLAADLTAELTTADHLTDWLAARLPSDLAVLNLTTRRLAAAVASANRPAADRLAACQPAASWLAGSSLADQLADWLADWLTDPTDPTELAIDLLADCLPTALAESVRSVAALLPADLTTG